MNDVIGLADFIQSRMFRAPHSLDLRHTQASFTRRDREDLEEWSSSDHRVSICTSEMGMFAMVYEAGRTWASWGVVRQGRVVLLWDCVTLADIGRFSNMIDALTAIPVDESPAPVANIIHFAAARARSVSSPVVDR